MLDIVDRVIAGQQIEDDTVELKARWPEPGHKLARQIAGHANASGGEPLLWLIGVNERARTLSDPGARETSNWWSGTRRWFDDVHPELVDTMVVPIAGGEHVIALTFLTDRAPYLVSTDTGGQVQREVPWRVANETRSAHRREILRSLLSRVSVPAIELISATATVARYRNAADFDSVYRSSRDTFKEGDVRLSCTVEMFVSTREAVNMPQHRQSLTVSGNAFAPVDIDDFTFRGPAGGPTKQSASGASYQLPLGTVVIADRRSLLVNTSTELTLMANKVVDSSSAVAVGSAGRVDVRLEMGVDQSDRSALLSVSLHRIAKIEDSKTRAQGPWETTAMFKFRQR